MIGYLKGKLIHKTENLLTINVSDIGYNVFVNEKTSNLFQLNQTLELFIYTKVREDEISLFGFERSDILDFFKQLISVNGIGPKSALEIVNNDIESVKNAIVQEDKVFLSKVPGIGKKTAEKIILELKSKININPNYKPSTKTKEESNQVEDAINALLSLGFNRAKINIGIKDIPQNLTSTEEIITYFLKNA